MNSVLRHHERPQLRAAGGAPPVDCTGAVAAAPHAPAYAQQRHQQRRRTRVVHPLASHLDHRDDDTAASQRRLRRNTKARYTDGAVKLPDLEDAHMADVEQPFERQASVCVDGPPVVAHVHLVAKQPRKPLSRVVCYQQARAI